jgi:virginiamycin B lyase
MSAAAQTINEFPLPTANSYPFAITTGPDGALWFTEYSGRGKIGRITTNGIISEFPTPTSGSGPSPITVGPDGALWFGEWFACKIGRVTQEGQFSEYYFGSPGYVCPGSITTGPDGALWITEDYPQIIRMNTDASITGSFYAGAYDYYPGSITTGPDGALWFIMSTSYYDARIGRITTTGTIDYFGSFPASSRPLPYITAGPDGALWFTENGANKIGRITTSGTITEFPSPGAPWGIAAGPDGALWFTEDYGSNKIGRMTTTGAVTEFPLPTANAGLGVITAGPDGALWFTEPGANQIGRIMPPELDCQVLCLIDVKFLGTSSQVATLTSSQLPQNASHTSALYPSSVADGVNSVPDLALQQSPGPQLPYKMGPTFRGLGMSFSGYTICGDCFAPDTNAAVGTSHVVETVNLSFAVFAKSSGSLQAGPANLSKPAFPGWNGVFERPMRDSAIRVSML